MRRYQEEARKVRAGKIPQDLWTKAGRATDGCADDVVSEALLNRLPRGLMATEWFYLADDDDAIYCTLNRGPVLELVDGEDWRRLPATFTPLARIRTDLRDATPDEAQRLPKPPST